MILPSLYSEIEGPALKNIVKILSNNKFLNHITIGLDKANKTQFKEIYSITIEMPHTPNLLNYLKNSVNIQVFYF